MRDWKTHFGFLFVTIGVTGLVVHQRAVERARALDDQRIAERWTPDDTAIIIEQQLAEQQRERGAPSPTCGCDVPKLMDQPIGDYPMTPHSRSELDALDRPRDEF